MSMTMLTHVRVINDYADTVLASSMTTQTNFLCKYLRKNGTVLPVDMGPGEVFDEKKCQKYRDTVPLNNPTLSLLYQ